MIQRQFLITLLVLALVISGCSSGNFSKDSIQDDPGDNTPFSLSIVNEIFDGNSLFLSGELKSKKNFSQPEIPKVIRLKTFTNGLLTGEAMLPNPEIDKQFTLSAYAKDFTDYQLDLLWGQEAVEFLSQIPLPKLVQIKDVTLTPADANKVRYIEGVLYNNGVLAIENIVLLVNFVYVPKGQYLDLETLKAENKEDTTSVLLVDNLKVLPFESKPFSIEVTSELPEYFDANHSPLGTWQVVVRVKDQ